MPQGVEHGERLNAWGGAVEVDVDDAVAEPPGQRVRDVHGERRLAHAAWPVHDRNARAQQRLPQPLRLLLPGGEGVDAGGQLGGDDRGGLLRCAEFEHRVLVEDGLPQPAQPRARFEAELLHHGGVPLLVHRQRLGRPVRPVEREHQLGTRPLPQRMSQDVRGQIGHHPVLVSPGQPQVDVVLEGGHALLLQALGLDSRPRIGQFGQGGPPPQGQRPPEQLVGRARIAPLARRPRLGGQPGEVVRVDLVAGQVQQVAAGHGRDRRWGERVAQLRHHDVQLLAGRGGRGLSPDVGDELLHGDGTAGVQRQARQYGDAAAAHQPHPSPAQRDLPGPEVPDLRCHQHRSLGRGGISPVCPPAAGLRPSRPGLVARRRNRRPSRPLTFQDGK